MFNYDQENFTWTISPDRKVVVGYSGGNFDGTIVLNSTNFVKANNDSSDPTG